MGQRIFHYWVNLNERGSFYADVRSPEGDTVFEIRAGDELGEDETSIFEDGFMRNADDVVGLERYMRDLSIIGKNDLVRREA